MNAQQDVVQNSLKVVSEARTALVEYGQQEYYDEEQVGHGWSFAQSIKYALIRESLNG